MRRWISLIKKISLAHLLLVEIIVGVLGNMASLFLFVHLTENILEKEVIFYDQIISRFIYTFRTPLLTAIMKVITAIGDAPIALLLSVLVIIFLIIKKHQNEFLILALSFITGGVVNFLLKMIFRLPRPQIAPLIIKDDFTYPSGHAMNNLVFYGLLVFFVFRFTRHKKLSLMVGMLAALWIGLIGFSRVYLGVHYPSDIIGGYLAGFWILLTALLVDKTIYLYQEARKH